MKAKKSAIIEVYPLLDKAKLSKMETADRKGLIKAMHAMKKVTTDFNDFRDDAVKRLRPEEFDKVEEVINKFQAMDNKGKQEVFNSAEYQEAFKANGEYNTAINDCLKEEVEKEVELDSTALSEEAVDRLIDSNDWTLGQIMAIENLLCGKED